MKSLSRLISCCLLVQALHGEIESPQTPEALVEAYRQAVQSADEAAVLALWALDQDNPDVTENLRAFVKGKIEQAKDKELLLVPWEAGNSDPFVMNGTKVEPLLPPLGGLKVLLDEDGGGIISPYGKGPAGYVLIGQRWTDLKWTGPADTMLAWSISSHSPANPDGPITVVIHYSASGIDLQKQLTLEEGAQSQSGGNWGQRVESIEVTTNAGPERSFSLWRDNRKELVFEGKIPAGFTGVAYTAGQKSADVSTTK